MRQCIFGMAVGRHFFLERDDILSYLRRTKEFIICTGC